jgi:hypothetical protein
MHGEAELSRGLPSSLPHADRSYGLQETGHRVGIPLTTRPDSLSWACRQIYLAALSDDLWDVVSYRATSKDSNDCRLTPRRRSRKCRRPPHWGSRKDRSTKLFERYQRR